MKTPLALRPVHARLSVAYLAHAALKYDDCKANNSFTRFGNFCKDIAETGHSQHPWFNMWCSIGEFYDSMNFGEMSDDEITDQYNGALRVGYTYKDTIVDASAVQQAVYAWRERGWKRYLQRSASRHRWVGRSAVIAALACVGVPTPPSA